MKRQKNREFPEIHSVRALKPDLRMPAASQPETDSLEELEMLLAGYRACAAEAIRFLTEEENVPMDSPLILGLWHHLLAQEARLDVEGLLSNHGSEADDSGVNMSADDNLLYSSTADAVLPTENAQQSSGTMSPLDTRDSGSQMAGATEIEPQTNRTSDARAESTVRLQYTPPVTIHPDVATVSTAPTTVSGTAC